MSNPVTSRRTVLSGLAAVPLVAAVVPASAAPSVVLSVEARRILELEPLYAVAVRKVCALCDDEPGHAEAEAETQAIQNEFESLCDVIYGRPVSSVSDLVDRALIGRWSAAENIDGSWGELRSGLYEKAMAETALSVLILAGLTDGEVERNGRPGETVEEVEAVWPKRFRTWVMDDHNAPEVRAGMSIEVNTAMLPCHGDLVHCRPGLEGTTDFVGEYQVSADNSRRIVTTNPNLPIRELSVTPEHTVGVVEWIVGPREALRGKAELVAGA